MLDKIGHEGKAVELDKRFLNALKATQEFIRSGIKSNLITKQESIAKKCAKEISQQFNNIDDIKKLLDPDNKITNSQQYKQEIENYKNNAKNAKLTKKEDIATSKQNHKLLEKSVEKLQKNILNTTDITQQGDIINNQYTTAQNSTNINDAIQDLQNPDTGWAALAVLIIQIKVCHDPSTMEDLIKQLNGCLTTYPALSSIITEITKEARDIEERLKTQEVQYTYILQKEEYQNIDTSKKENTEMGYFIKQIAPIITQNLHDTLEKEGFEGVAKKIEQEVKQVNFIKIGPFSNTHCKTVSDIKNVFNQKMTIEEKNAEEKHYEKILNDMNPIGKLPIEQRNKFIFNRVCQYAESQAHKILETYPEVRGKSELHCLFAGKYYSIVERMIEKSIVMEKEMHVAEKSHNKINDKKFAELLERNKVDIGFVTKYQINQNDSPEVSKIGIFENKLKNKKMMEYDNKGRSR